MGKNNLHEIIILLLFFSTDSTGKGKAMQITGTHTEVNVDQTVDLSHQGR